MDLVIGDIGALQPDRLIGAHRQEECVAHTDQLLRARLIKDDAAVSQRRRRERQPGRHVGLDQTGDHIHRWPLGGQHEVDTGRAGLLGDPHDRIFDVARGGHHQVGQLVNDRDDIRIGLVHPLTAEWRGDLPGSHLGVEVVDVTHARGLHVLITLFHLLDQPGQRGGCLLGLGDDRGDQMRNAFIRSQFHHLRVDEDHPHFLGCGPGQQRDQHRVDEAGLTGTGGTGHQQVRHLRQVRRDEVALDVLTQTDHQRVVVTTGRGCGEHIGQPHHFTIGVGHFNTHGGFTGDRRQHPHALGGHRVGDIALQRSDFLDLDPGSEFHLVAGDGRPAGTPGD